MSGHYSVPDHVQANINTRAAARRVSTQCAGEAGRCRRPATRRCARYGGSYCQTCWDALPRVETPRPDPARCLDALRTARGLQVLSIAETLVDTRARDSGKRASGDRRRAAHDTVLEQVAERTDEWTRRQVLDVIASLVRRGQPFSANDVRPLLPPGIPASVMGACWSRAVRHHQLVEVGRVPDGYGHRIPVWQPKEAA